MTNNFNYKKTDNKNITNSKIVNNSESFIDNEFQQNNVGKSMRSASEQTETNDPKEALLGSDRDYTIDVTTLSGGENIDISDDYYQMSFTNKKTVYGIKMQTGVDDNTTTDLPGKIVVFYSLSSLDKDAFMPVISSVSDNSYVVFDSTSSEINDIKDVLFENPISARHIRIYVIETASPSSTSPNTCKFRTDVILTPAYYFAIQNVSVDTTVNISNEVTNISEMGKYLSHINNHTPLKFYSDKMGRREIYLFKTIDGKNIDFEGMEMGTSNQGFDAFILRSVAANDDVYCKIDNNKMICNSSSSRPSNLLRFKLAPTTIDDLDSSSKLMTIQDISSNKYANNKFEFVINNESEANIFAIKRTDTNEIKDIQTVNQYVDEKEKEALGEYNDCLGSDIYYVNLRRCYNEKTIKSEHESAIVNVNGGLPREISSNDDEINIQTSSNYKTIQFLKQGVTMFEGQAFNGKSLNFPGDSPPTSYQTDTTNNIIPGHNQTDYINTNSISSFIVYPGYKLIVFDNDTIQSDDNGIEFTEGKYSVRNVGDISSGQNRRIYNKEGEYILNDAISSFKVEKIFSSADETILKYNYKQSSSDDDTNYIPQCPSTTDLMYNSLQIGDEADNKISFNTKSDTYKPELYEGKKVGNRYNKLIKSHRPTSLKNLIPEVIKVCIPKTLMNGSTLTNSFVIRTKIFDIQNDDGEFIHQDFTINNDVITSVKCSNSSVVNNLYKIKENKNPSPTLSTSLPVYELVSPSDPEYKNIDCGCNCLNNNSHINNYMDTNSYTKGILNNLITRTDDVLSRRNQEITEVQTVEESILNQPQTQDYLNYEKTNLLDTNKFINRDEIINYYNVKGNEGFQGNIRENNSTSLGEFNGTYKIYDGQFVLLDNSKIKINNETITFIRLNTPVYKFKYDSKVPFYSPYTTFEGVKYRVINKDKMVHDIETNNLENLFLSIGLKVPNFIYVSKHTRILDDGTLDIYYKFSNREYTTLFQMVKI